MENKVLLSDILISWFDCREAYEKQENQEIIKEKEEKLTLLKQNLLIKSRLTMSEKAEALIYIAWNFQKSEKDAVETTVCLECAKIIYGLLAYAGVENDLNDIAIGSTVVDALYDSGIIEEILKFCERDYRYLEQMVDRMLNYSNLFQMVEMFEGLDADKLDKTVKAMKKMIQGIDAETVKNLATITQNNDPITAAVASTLSEQGLLKSDELTQIIKNTERQSANEE